MAKFRRRRQRTIRDVLEGLGFSAEAIDEAEAAGTDELLAIDAVVLPETAKFTMAEVAAKVGMPVEAVQRFWRALGFVDASDGDRIFTKRDVAIMKSLVDLTADGLFDPDIALQVARVIGVSVAQVATAVVDSGANRSDERRDTASALVGSDGGEDDGTGAAPNGDAGSLAVRAGELLPFMADVIDYAFRRHLRAAARRRVALATSDDDHQVVGFADLVKYSELSLQLDDRALAELVGRFDHLMHEVVVRHGGRIVKMIGDAAMFSVVDPIQAGLIALDLSDAVARDDLLTGLRVGMASGPTLARDGDLYGPVVNAASRLVTIGRAGAINVSPSLRDAIAADHRFALRSLGTRSLRHIGEMRVYRLSPGRDWDAFRRHPASSSTVPGTTHR